MGADMSSTDFCRSKKWFLGAVCSTAILVSIFVSRPGNAQTTKPNAATARAAARGGEFEAVKPESVGFSSARLDHLKEATHRAVDQKQLSGVVTLVLRHGKIVESDAYGQRDLSTGAPMEKDTIFRIYSMTKPITSTAMMILYEEGKWNPLDPISKYIPEFANLKVYKGVNASGDIQTEDPIHPPTMRELMTHTAGFVYGGGKTPIDAMFREKGVLHSASLQEMIDRLATMPLLYQPGTRWLYSSSVDIQGYIVERLSGMTLPDFMREKIFAPLGMRDTGFYVPPEKLNRFAALYQWDAKQGKLVPGDASQLGVSYAKQPTMPSGGAGLVSTARDYARFAQMLLNGGELGGVRILGPETVKLQTSNHLPPELLCSDIGMRFWGEARCGFGYGYDMAVFLDPALADSPVGKGTFLWDGAASTWFWADPVNDIVSVGMVQRLNGGPFTGGMQEIARAAVYQALVNPAK
jgi:CubicO group peptidase (beta-lactamase class C family)